MKLPSCLRHIFTVGALTALSRVLGLVREVLQAKLIGAGIEQSAFTLAFAIPNMARKLFGEGALTAAFIPIFKGELENGAEESARRLARAVMTMMLLILTAIAVLTIVTLSGFIAFMPSLSPRAHLTLQLVRVLIPYMIFICGAAFGMGVLNSLGRFVAAGFMPALLNIVWILTLLILCFFPGFSLSTRVSWVAIAILIGGAAQMLFLFACMARRGFPPRFSLKDIHSSKVRAVWTNTFIAAMGAGAVQINYMLDQLLAQVASPWAAGVIGYAERLMDLPLGIIGVAFGTVLLPTFSGLFAKKDMEGARTTFRNSLIQLMLVMCPAGVGLFILAPEITALIYQRGAFDAQATLRVSRALAVYATGLCFFSFMKTLTPWFQAQQDMRTPLRVSVLTVCVNAVLNVLAVWLLPVEWRHVGLAASTVFCSALGCLVLVLLAVQKNGSLGLRALFSPFVRIILASAVMAVAVLGVQAVLSSSGLWLLLAGTIATGLVSYGLMALAFRLVRLPRFRSF